MTARTNFAICLTPPLAAILLAGIAHAQVGSHNGLGFGRGPGGGRRYDVRHNEDHEVFRFLLTNHTKIKRDVKEVRDGVETLTESDDPVIAAKIKDHVKWMQYRVEETKPIRMRDPLFAELFRHTDKIKMVVETTEKGVRVKETSADEYVATLIKSHAAAVSGFVAHGFKEAIKDHPVPLEVSNDIPESSSPANAK